MIGDNYKSLMRACFHLTLCLLASVFFFGTAFSKSDSQPTQEGITLSSLALSRILDKQARFFDYPGRSPQKNDLELTRKAQEIVADYDAYLGANPKDTNALILYGKFLRRVGQEQHAVGYFLEADSINPKLAVVKQQLANYLIEEGRPIDAFPFLIMTIELAPEQADYHYHLGNFLFLFEDDLAREGILAKDSARAFMHKSFKQAAKLSPSNFDYQLRFAQSFFDHPGSSKESALVAWSDLARKFPDRSKAENDYFNLCKARVLLELNRQSDALPLLQSVSSKALDSAKRSLLHQVKRKPQKEIKKGTQKQSRIEINHRFFIPDDPHLKRLRLLTERIKEEKMLSELKSDAIKARFDEKNQIKIDLSQRNPDQSGHDVEKGSLR